jgi:Restriction endonuclease
MTSDDEYLERVVAGIHSVTTAGADVNWNEVVNGRQFDVVVRFKLGTLRYLVLVEVKNRSRKAEATDMDAFVLKARDQNANKAVFVTAAGFQEGAKTVAKRHGVDLFTVTFDEGAPTIPKDAAIIVVRKKDAPKSIPARFELGEPTLIRNIDDARLVYADGKEIEVPSEPSQMNYYCRKTRLQDGSSLSSLIENAPLAAAKLGQSRTEVIRVNPPQPIEPPDAHFFPSGVITAIKCTITGRQGIPIRGNARIDPNLFVHPVIYTNVLTGETSRFAIDQLPLGVKRVSPGQFYFIYHPLSYFIVTVSKASKYAGT